MKKIKIIAFCSAMLIAASAVFAGCGCEKENTESSVVSTQEESQKISAKPAEGTRPVNPVSNSQSSAKQEATQKVSAKPAPSPRPTSASSTAKQPTEPNE